MGRTKREDFVMDVATELFIRSTTKYGIAVAGLPEGEQREKSIEAQLKQSAKRSVDGAGFLYDILVEQGLVK
jgi:hypothetical protein